MAASGELKASHLLSCTSQIAMQLPWKPLWHCCRSLCFPARTCARHLFLRKMTFLCYCAAELKHSAQTRKRRVAATPLSRKLFSWSGTGNPVWTAKSTMRTSSVMSFSVCACSCDPNKLIHILCCPSFTALIQQRTAQH